MPIEYQVFPYFGGKRRVAEAVWSRFGRVDGYLEPFGGSLAMALANPHPDALKSENLNDFDGLVCNFWRAVAAAPEEVASWADWPVSHLDLTARHDWLRAQRVELVERLRADVDYHDAKIAGWWWWGICQWIGSGWGVVSHSKRPHLGDHGMGVHSLGKRPHLRDHGVGVHSLGQRDGLYQTTQELAARLRYSRISCCDWRSLRSTLHSACARWGVFLDPPYTAASGRNMTLYGNSSTDEATLGVQVAEWAVEIGCKHRVALCGIDGEYDIPEEWERYYWKTGGYSYGNRDRQEVIWFSPACAEKPQGVLF